MKLCKMIQDESAQALVESAIAIPVLIILFFGCLELIHMGIGHIVVREAVFEAGRMCYLDKEDQQNAERIAKEICSKISKGNTDFYIDEPPQGARVYVVSHQIKPIVPVIPSREIKYSVPVFMFESGD